MNSYPFDTIDVNGRSIRLAEIIDQATAPQSEFEATLFLFVKQWFSGTETFLQQTSGSTGAPKAIEITRQQMIASASLTTTALNLQPGYRALVCLHTSYIAGKMMLVRAFTTGMLVEAITPSANPLEFASLHPIDFCAMVPLQVYELVRSPFATRLNQIKVLLIGGGSLDKETHEMLQGYSCACYATYGMTETISHIALKALNGKDASPFFTTLPGIYIAHDERGCLLIQWDALGKIITTNDLVDIVVPDQFSWIGRVDNVINTGGMKVIPEKVEAVIADICRVLQIRNRFFISSVPDDKFGNRIVLLFEGTIETPLIEEFNNRMRTLLESFEQPKDVFQTANFKETLNGKINRKSTLDLTLGGRDSSDGNVNLTKD